MYKGNTSRIALAKTSKIELGARHKRGRGEGVGGMCINSRKKERIDWDIWEGKKRAKGEGTKSKPPLLKGEEGRPQERLVGN